MTMKTSKPSVAPPRLAFLLVFLLLAVGIISAGTFYYRYIALQFRIESEKQLSAIANLKVGELNQWREDRRTDGAIFYKNPSFAALVRRFFAQPADADAQRQLHDWLGKYPTLDDYDQIRLMDTQAVTRFTLPGGLNPACSVTVRAAAEAVRLGRITLQDFYRHEHNQRVYLSVQIPILDELDANRPLGVLVLRIDPVKYLYPFIQHWPVPSKTAETLLLRRGGSEVLYLNELRHQTNTALALRIPLARTGVPAVRAALGQTGIMHGIDYRGTPVLAAAQAVPDSPWFLIAKIDTAEVYVPLRTQLWQVVAMIGVLFFGAGAFVGLVWWQQHVWHLKEQIAGAETLRKSEARLKRAQQMAHICDWEWDIKQGTLRWEEEHYRIFGVPRETIPSVETFLATVHPDDLERVKRSMDDALKGKAAYDLDFRIRRLTDGTERVVHASGELTRNAEDQPVQFFGTVQDITERKQEEAYHEMGLKILQILNGPGELPEIIGHVIAALKTGTGCDAVGLRLQDGDDFPYFAQNGFSKEFLLTENTLIAHDADGGVCRDKDGNLCLECTCGLVISGKTDPANPLFTRGGSCWTNDSFLLLDHPSDQDPRLHPRNTCIHKGYASVALIPIRTKDKIVGLIHLNDQCKDRFTLEMVELLENISAHIGDALMRKQAAEALQETNKNLQQSLEQVREMQAKMIQQERLSALGLMASGIAHDFNNALMPILGFSELMLEDPTALDDRKNALRMLMMIHAAGDDARQIVRRLRDVYRKDDTAEYAMVDLSRIVESAISLTMPKWKEEASTRGATIEMVTDFQPAPLIRGNDCELREAITNLIFNATDAMPMGGAIALRVFKRNESTVILEVADTGVGMDQVTLQHCMEPFYTTKGVQGTGLGLAMVYGIITRHAGTIKIDSVPGAGTTVRLQFPVPVSPGSTVVEPEQVQLAPLRILVIDDEQRTRDLLAKVLKNDGHHVDMADTPHGGLDMFRHGTYDLVITDRAMRK